MKTAEEVADEISSKYGMTIGAAIEIKQALIAYAEERVKEATAAFLSDAIRADNKARAEALEEAAKILDKDCEKLAAHGAEGPALQCNIQAMKIRALKGKA